MMLAQNRQVCGRGVLALKSRKPIRRPGSISNQNSQSSLKNSNSHEGQTIPTPPGTEHGPNPTMLVKYSYEANPKQPRGFPEMTVKQGEKVQFLNVHPDQPLWWHVREQMGQRSGYVPGSYLMVLRKKPSSLPWLENKRLEGKKVAQSEPKKGTSGNAPVNLWKPYVSAYGARAMAGPNSQEKKYYCEVCDKQLNGPKPYQAHMVSKAHKEELEAQGLS